MTKSREVSLHSLGRFVVPLSACIACFLTMAATLPNVVCFMVNSPTLQYSSSNARSYDYVGNLRSAAIAADSGGMPQGRKEALFTYGREGKGRRKNSFSFSSLLPPSSSGGSTITSLFSSPSCQNSRGQIAVIKEGDEVPQCEWKIRKELQDGSYDWGTIKTQDIFAKDKLVVLFALPGAFTPTCSSTHLPKYEELYPEIKKQGVHEVYCLSVNDAFVMNAWKKHQNVRNVQLIPDGSAAFTDMLGLGVQKDNIGFGRRSWRYSMVINGGKVEKIFEEEGRKDNAEGDPFGVSDANTMLNYLIQRRR